MKKIIIFIILLLSILSAKVPSWVNNRPISEVYYIGISTIQKADNVNYRDMGKLMALKDLASEITVKVEDESKYSVKENGSQAESFISDFQKSSKIVTVADLEDYEFVDAYETEKEYSVYYQLSKRKYFEKQVLKKINSSQYYVSKGCCSKEDVNYLAKAKRNALEELSTEISAKYFNNQTYLDKNISEYINNQFIEMLDGYEVIFSFESKREYWIYYKLSKDRWSEIYRNIYEKAVKRALDYYAECERSLSKDPHKSLSMLLEAYKAVEFFQDDQIKVSVEGKQIFLKQQIITDFQDIIDKIKISSDLTLTIPHSTDVNRKLKINTNYLGNNYLLPLNGFLLTIKFTKGAGNLSSNFITSNGLTELVIYKLISEEKTQRISISLDLLELLPSHVKSPILIKLVESFKKPEFELIINTATDKRLIAEDIIAKADRLREISFSDAFYEYCNSIKAVNILENKYKEDKNTLYEKILKGMQQMLDNLSVIIVDSNQILQYGTVINANVQTKLLYNFKNKPLPIVNFPFTFSVVKGNVENSTEGKTNEDSKLDLLITKINSKDGIIQIKIIPDFSKVANINYEEEKDYLNKLKLPNLILTIKTIDPQINLAISLIRIADKYKPIDPYLSIKSYFRALKILSIYSNQNIKINYENNEVLVFDYINNSIQGILDNIETIKPTERISLISNKDISKTVAITTKYKVNSSAVITHFPFKIYFEKGNGKISENVTTDTKGQLSIKINKINSKEKLQIIAIRPDYESIRNTVDSLCILEKMNHKFNCEPIKIEMDVSDIKFAIKVEEKNIGKLVNTIDAKIKKDLLSQGFEIANSNDEAQFSIYISAETSKGSEVYGQFIAFADAIIAINDVKSSEVVFKTQKQKIKGVQLDYENAGLKALDELYKEINRDLFNGLLNKLKNR